MFMGDEYERAGLALLLADEVLRTERTLSVPFGWSTPLRWRASAGGGAWVTVDCGSPWSSWETAVRTLAP